MIESNNMKLSFTNFNNNSNNNNRVIPCQIIQFLDVDTLISQIMATPLPPADNAEITNPWKLQPSTLHVSKPLRPYWSDSCRKWNLKGVCLCADGDVGS